MAEKGEGRGAEGTDQGGNRRRPIEEGSTEGGAGSRPRKEGLAKQMVGRDLWGAGGPEIGKGGRISSTGLGKKEGENAFGD